MVEVFDTSLDPVCIGAVGTNQFASSSIRAAGNLRPQLPAAQQGKTVGRTELPHQLVLIDDLARPNACNNGGTAGRLSENYRPQHRPTGKKASADSEREEPKLTRQNPVT